MRDSELRVGGDTPLPLGAPELHAITVHFFSRQNR